MEKFEKRLRKEKKQLEKRGDRLASFLKRKDFDRLDNTQKELLTEQLGHMTAYLSVLNDRLDFIDHNNESAPDVKPETTRVFFDIIYDGETIRVKNNLDEVTEFNAFIVKQIVTEWMEKDEDTEKAFTTITK